MKRRRFLQAGGLAAGILLASGCTTLSSAPGHDPEPAEPLGPPLDDFGVSGRLALRQAERSDQLGFDWTHTAASDRVLFLTPLGQGVAEIVRDAAGARLLRPDAETVAEADLASLARRMFGTALPLGELADWLRGARGYRGEADGWQVEVAATVSYPARGMPSLQRRLPRRLELRKDDVLLTLIVTEWGDPE